VTLTASYVATYKWPMSQVTIYLPPDVERLVRREAKKARKSLSAWLTELARREVQPSGWPEGYFEALKVPGGAPMVLTDDLPLDEVEPLR
jgi:hypothetical protein